MTPRRVCDAIDMKKEAYTSAPPFLFHVPCAALSE